MKRIANLLSVLVASVVGGVVGAYATIQIFEGKADKLMSQLASDFVEYPQGDIAVYMGNITAAEEGNTEGLLLLNCVLLRAKIGHIHPDLEATPRKRQELEELKAKANETVSRLTQNGLCTL